jgi:hypothetical protein
MDAEKPVITEITVKEPVVIFGFWCIGCVTTRLAQAGCRGAGQESEK